MFVLTCCPTWYHPWSFPIEPFPVLHIFKRILNILTPTRSMKGNKTDALVLKYASLMQTTVEDSRLYLS